MELMEHMSNPNPNPFSAYCHCHHVAVVSSSSSTTTASIIPSLLHPSAPAFIVSFLCSHRRHPMLRHLLFEIAIPLSAKPLDLSYSLHRRFCFFLLFFAASTPFAAVAAFRS
ncbi:hypothetical protein PIB30_020157 [Stylosanthes scabra]|uniref:Uncharacterized protein n=1 Tax=Stylosanthes scabra TaxID=79078 RepID=A0ABU6Z704_9FABA|nr:hypothetical protein [Stylosanthes scabra]